LTWWTTHLGVAPAEVVALAHDDGALVAALVQAALRQRDAVWAEALLRAGEPDVAQTIALVGLVPSESGRLLRRLQGLGDKLPPVLTQWAASLGTALDPSVAPELEAWVGALADNDAARRKVREVIQALTLRATIEQEMP
jgi:hypothetical protein